MSTEAGFSPAAFPAIDLGGETQSQARGQARGHAAGYAAGLRAAAEETRRLRERLEAEHAAELELHRAALDRAVGVLTTAVQALNRRTLPVVAESQDILAASAFDLAEAIVGYELADAEGSARAALSRALAQPMKPVKPLVRMNPDDLALLADDILDHGEVTFLPDPGLARGDAVAEYPDGFLDARIGTALDRAKQALLLGVQ